MADFNIKKQKETEELHVLIDDIESCCTDNQNVNKNRHINYVKGKRKIIRYKDFWKWGESILEIKHFTFLSMEKRKSRSLKCLFKKKVLIEWTKKVWNSFIQFNLKES